MGTYNDMAAERQATGTVVLTKIEDLPASAFTVKQWQLIHRLYQGELLSKGELDELIKVANENAAS